MPCKILNCDRYMYVHGTADPFDVILNRKNTLRYNDNYLNFPVVGIFNKYCHYSK